MVQIKEMPDTERPREKGIQYGVRSLSTRELLAVLLRTGIRGQSALETADLLLQKASGVQGIARMSLQELSSIEGMSRIKALEIQAALELSRRICLEDTKDVDVISRPEVAVKWLQREIGSSLQEVFMVLYLNSSGCIIKHEALFKGTINASSVYPREVLREALLVNSTAIMLVHNHPGGDLVPSNADITMTQKMILLAKEMGIRVLDHLIITQYGWTSFAAAGILEECMTGNKKEW